MVQLTKSERELIKKVNAQSDAYEKQRLERLPQVLQNMKEEKIRDKENNRQSSRIEALRFYTRDRYVEGVNALEKKLGKKRTKQTNARANGFAGRVTSQNVQGIIPPIESRGMHNMVTHNPFSSPEKEVERDPRTGLLHVKNGIWG